VPSRRLRLPREATARPMPTPPAPQHGGATDSRDVAYGTTPPPPPSHRVPQPLSAFRGLKERPPLRPHIYNILYWGYTPYRLACIFARQLSVASTDAGAAGSHHPYPLAHARQTSREKCALEGQCSRSSIWKDKLARGQFRGSLSLARCG